MLIPLVQKALVKNGAYELLGHFQLKLMDQLKPDGKTSY
jgi:hypothetical protein